jgi:hypothetical protein
MGTLNTQSQSGHLSCLPRLSKATITGIITITNNVKARTSSVKFMYNLPCQTLIQNIIKLYKLYYNRWK